MTVRTWTVLQEILRLDLPAAIGDTLGEVTAPDQPTALKLAKWLYGDRVLVQPKSGAPACAADPQMPTAAEPAREKRAPPEWRAMTADEVTMALALGRCSFVPATFDKRFAGALWSRAKYVTEPQITAREAALLRVKVHRYRRQLPSDVVRLAGHPAELQTEKR